MLEKIGYTSELNLNSFCEEDPVTKDCIIGYNATFKPVYNFFGVILPSPITQVKVNYYSDETKLAEALEKKHDKLCRTRLQVVEKKGDFCISELKFISKKSEFRNAYFTAKLHELTGQKNQRIDEVSNAIYEMALKKYSPAEILLFNESLNEVVENNFVEEANHKTTVVYGVV